MIRPLSVLAVIAVLVSGARAQVAPCAGFNQTVAWSDLPAATPLGGGTGPEDIAYNPVTGTLFVIHDFPNASPDILLEYSLDGQLLFSAVNLPSVSGLAAMPNGNLLLAGGSTILEITTTGLPVPGGISVNLPAYGGIQDLDLDALGRIWIHNGNTGDFSIVNVQTQTSTTQFILQTQFNPGVPPAVTGSQAMAFNDAGNILACAAFFQNGGLANGTLLEINPAGQVVCAGGTPASATLRADADPCVASPAGFTIVNGLTWIGPLREIALSNFFTVNGSNVSRFAPLNSAMAARIGADAVRADGLPFRAVSAGDPLIGASGFSLTQTNLFPGDTLYWLVSAARLCANPPLGSGFLYADPFPPNILFLFTFPVATPAFTIPIDLSTVPPAAAGIEVFSQFGGLDLSSPVFSTLLSSCHRVRLHLN